jgi:hypothetical protein
MSRYDIDEIKLEEDNQIFDRENQRFTKRNTDQPKRSSIRRKDKWRPEKGMKPKAKRNYKKVQRQLKYDWPVE